MIGLLPLGALQVRVAEVSPALTVVTVGAVAAEYGTPAFEGELAAEVPLALTAASVNV